MIILGVNAYHGDSSACLVVDGKLVAAAEEERFTRVKHWAGYPAQAIAYVLKEAGVKISDVDRVAVNRDPSANRVKKIAYTLTHHPDPGAILGRLRNAGKIQSIHLLLGVPEQKIVNVEHHRAHLASAFFVSPFERAAVVSVDGFGDFVSTMWGVGSGSSIEISEAVYFPHSLGLFYLALTQYLGFPNYGDEYKVMGLAPYGQPSELKLLQRVVTEDAQGKFKLDLSYFHHHSKGVSMSWLNGSPEIGQVYSDKLVSLLGPARKPDEAIQPQHQNIAASVQALYEQHFFRLLNYVRQKTGETALALAGGCAMNSVANGKIYENTSFKRLYIQAASGDAGGAIGAAFYVWNQKSHKSRHFVMDHAYWGPAFSDDQNAAAIERRKADLEAAGCLVKKIEQEDRLCLNAAKAISEGKVLGWFQGRMEWGPRALGNRSILADPRRGDMKKLLNEKIKHRESFRPFAPSILREEVPNWFEVDDDVPFMLQVYPVKSEKRALIPAVTHVNGSGRLQTVQKDQNPLYYRLIQAFHSVTGVPLLLNTSFNENEPVVCEPSHALDCFLRTKMDVLVLGNHWIERTGGAA